MLDLVVRAVVRLLSLGPESHPTQTMGGLVNDIQKGPLVSRKKSCLCGFKIRFRISMSITGGGECSKLKVG